MEDAENLKFENYFKLIRLLQEAKKYFAEIFKEKYKQKFKSEWIDNKQSANEFKKSAEKIKSELKGSAFVNFDNGNTNDWDLTLLGKVLNSNMFKDKNTKWINEIIVIRNENAHSSNLSISDKKYEEFYAKYFKAMTSLGYSAEKLNKFKIDISKKDINNNSNFSDIKQAKKMANEEINNKNYSKAIEIYSNLLKSFDNLSSEQKADLFYERSVVNLLYYKSVNSNDEKYLHRSLLDAKQSNMLEPRWSKTYSHIGEIYHKLDELEESENFYEMALALDVSNEKIKNSLALIKNKNNQQKRHEHMNANSFPETTEERTRKSFKKMTEKMGLISKISEMQEFEKFTNEKISLIGMDDPSFLDVIKGHECRDGSLNVKKDYATAAQYYAKAAQSKNAEAMYNLALFYQKGSGVKVDYKMSISLLKQAASQNPIRKMIGMEIQNVGVAEAEHSLGLAYYEGVYVDKNPCIAAEWYEKAVKHNYSSSANNLGILCMHGDGVEQNLDKAEDLFLLSHKLNNIDCIFNLIDLYLIKNDPERALMWHERALKSDLSVLALSRDEKIREICENKIKLKNLKEKHSKSNESLKVADEFFNFNNKCASKKISPSISHEKAEKNSKKFDSLFEYVTNGSIQARNMVESQFSFYSAIFMLDESDLDKYDFVNLMSQAFKIEAFTWQIDENKREKALQIIEEVISENKVSEADCNARICYMYLKLDKIIPFISESLKKYPNNLVMLELRGCMYGFEKKWDMALKDFDKILESDPHNYSYLYNKATAYFQNLDEIDNNIKIKECIKHFETFLEYSPRDYRKVPEAYYTMATLCTGKIKNNETFLFEKTKTYYNKGIDSEKFMLPYFLPYESNKKLSLEMLLKLEKVLPDKETEKSELDKQPLVKGSNLNTQRILDKESIINDYRRKALVLDHRKYYFDFKSKLSMKNTLIPPKKQKMAASIANLKALFLKDIDFSHDHIMDGYVLTMINIDIPVYQPPPLSTLFLAQDENGMVERVAMYNLGLSEKSILETYKIGCKFSIINPYIRMTGDSKPMIRIDDPRTIILSDEQMNNPCCFCLKEDSKYSCSKCHRAKYCSKECQIDDWKIFQHKNLCSN